MKPGMTKLMEKVFSEHFVDYKNFLYRTDVNTNGRENTDVYGKTIHHYEKKKYGRIQWNPTDKEVAASIEEFFQIIDHEGGYLSHMERVLNVMQRNYGAGNEAEARLCINEDTTIKVIVVYFLNCIKKDLSNYSYLKPQRDSDFTYDNYIAIVKNLLTDRNPYYQICSFLYIVKELRNIFDHDNINKTLDLQDAYVINRFALYTFMATVLALRKVLGLGEFAFVPLKLNVFHPVSSNITLKHNDEIIFGQKEGKTKTVFTIDRYKDYCIEVTNIGTQKFVCQWNSRQPSLHCNNTIVFKNNECEFSSTDTQGAFSHTMERVDAVLDTLKDLGISVESIDKNTKEILEELQGLSKISDNTLKSTRSQEEILERIQETLGNKLDNLTKAIKKNDIQSNKSEENIHKLLASLLERLIEIEQTERSKRKDDAKRKMIWAGIGTTILAFILIAIVFLCFLPKNVLTPAALVEKGNDLYAQGKYEKAGKVWRQAIDAYKEQLNDNTTSSVNSCIRLAELYISGKGAYNVDSAFIYVQQPEVRADKYGQGLYAYMLFMRGDYDNARREIARAINKDSPYMKLTKAMLASINRGGLVEDVENLIKTIDNDEARYQYALLKLWGIQNHDSTAFIVTPDMGLSFHIINSLAKQLPKALMIKGNIHHMACDNVSAMNCYGEALSCGIQYGAINSNLIYLLGDIKIQNQDGHDMLKEMRGKANMVGGMGGLLYDYRLYEESKDYDLAVNAADSLIALYNSDKKWHSHEFELEELNNASFIKSLRITSRLQTGNPEQFKEAVQLAMQRDDCSDSIAVALYLKGICKAKGYGCDVDSVQADSLFIESFTRNTYIEACYTALRKTISQSHKYQICLLGMEGDCLVIQKGFSDLINNRDFLRKSPKLAEIIIDILIQRHDEYPNQDLSLYIEEVEPFLPKQVQLVKHIIDKRIDAQELASNRTIFNALSTDHGIKEIYLNILSTIKEAIWRYMKNKQYDRVRLLSTMYCALASRFDIEDGEMYKELLHDEEIKEIEGEFDLQIVPFSRYPLYPY